MLRKSYCPASLVILIKIQGSNEEPELLSQNKLSLVPYNKFNGRCNVGAPEK